MGQDQPSAVTTVCLFSPSALPLVLGGAGRAGGAELDVWNIATALARDPAFRPTLAAVGDADERATAANVDVVSIARTQSGPTGRGYFARYCLRVVRALREVNADVYFSKGASLEAVLCFAAARVARRRRFVFRLQHDWETNPDTLITRIFGGQRRLARLFMRVLERADVRVVQTAAQQQLLKDGFGLDSTVVYNGHPVGPAPPFDAKRTALWIGRAASYKRPEVFLALAERLPSHPFVMVATRDENFPEVIERIRERSRRLQNLTLIDGVPRDEIERLFAAARVFVLTSEAEGFPNVLVEAWKSRTPVASLRVDPDGLIRRHHAGFVADDDVEVLTRGVEELLEHDAPFRAAADRAYQAANEHLNIARTIEVYKRLFTGRAGPDHG